MKKILSLILATTLAFTFSTSVFAQSYDTEITSSGDATISVAPDIAYLSLGVVTEDKSSQKASEQNKATVTKLISALENYGIKSTDIETQYYNVFPNYNYSDKGNTSIVGYNVTHQIKVTVRDINDVGEILDLAIENGSNVNTGIAFDVENKDSLYEQALIMAIDKAVSKGNKMANAIGVTGAKVTKVNENSSYSYGTTQTIEAKSSDSVASATPISAGNVSVYASVTVILGK